MESTNNSGINGGQIRFWEALAAHVGLAAQATSLPQVSHLELPPADPDHRKRNNFAALILEDGTVGMTYVALDGALAGLRSRFGDSPGALAGQSPLALVDYYAGPAGWERALGLAAINAISQHLLAASDPLPPMPETLPMLGLRPGDHIGMVGFYGRLVTPILAAGARLTVIELDASLVREEGGLTVTLDPHRLKDCTQVIVTGTTLLNASLDNVLTHCGSGAGVNLLGPSASCLPDALFERGVTRVGGIHIQDTDRFLAEWRRGGRWRDAGYRYQLEPGYRASLGGPET